MQTPQELQHAIQRHESYLEVDPDNLLLRTTLGDLYHQAGRLDDANACYDRCLQQKPGDAVALGRRASVLLSQGRFPEAEQSLRRPIEAGDSTPALTYNLGIAVFCQERWDEARTCFIDAIDRGIVTAEAFAYLTRTLHHLGAMAEAIAAGHRWAELSRDGKGASYLSMLYMDNDDAEHGMRLARDVLVEHPDDVHANVVVGMGLSRTQDVASARAHFETALRQDRENGRAWLGLGTVQFYQQEHARAIESLGHAVRLFPENAGVIILLGWAKLMAQDAKGAEAVFEQALRVNRMAPEAHGGLASALAFQNEVERAEHEIRLARRLDPNGFGAEFAEVTLLSVRGQTREATDLFEQILRRAPREGMLPVIEQLRIYAAKNARPQPGRSSARRAAKARRK